MPATQFICPDGEKTPIWGPDGCLSTCRMGSRCIMLPTMRAIAQSVAPRKLHGFSVTELIKGARETFLMRTNDYAVDPQDTAFAVHGSAIHDVNQRHSYGNFLAEERLSYKGISGQFDLYGDLLGNGKAYVGDYKNVASYKVMRAMGGYLKNVDTGEFFKTGPRKGLPKTKKVLFTDGVHDVFDWAIQTNFYRILLEQAGFQVDGMLVQAIVRDWNVAVCSARGIDRRIYVMRMNPISDNHIFRFLEEKRKTVETALSRDTTPPPCNVRERWNDRKCEKWCAVADHCDHAQKLKHLAALKSSKPKEEDVA